MESSTRPAGAKPPQGEPRGGAPRAIIDELSPPSAQTASGRGEVVRFIGRRHIVAPVRCTDAVGVDTVEMDPMSVGFGDMDEHAGQKLERVEQGLVVQFMSCFGLVEEELGFRVIAKPGEVHRRAHPVAGELAAFAKASAGQDGAPPCRRDRR